VEFKFTSAVALLAMCVPATDAFAQPTDPPAGVGVSTSVPASPAPATTSDETLVPLCWRVAALTPVELEFVDAASSRTNKPGDLVSLRLAEPLVIDGHVVAPTGSPVLVEVIQASKAGLMGKAGELTFAARYVTVGGTRIPLKRFGFGRSQGRDPSGTLNVLNTAAAVALPVASVALIFVSGGNVDIKPGARAHAVVATETLVPSNP